MEIKGVEQVVHNLSNFSKSMIVELTAGCEAVQAKVVNDAIAIAPEDTGNLKRNIQAGDIIIEDDNISAIIEANTEYASYVELGTKLMKAQPYLLPALIGNMRVFERAMAAAAKRARAK